MTGSRPGTTQVATPLGPARVLASEPAQAPTGTLVLGHGAGGGAHSLDLVAVSAGATDAGWRVLRVEQPWRVAGLRVAPAPARLDVGWRAVLAALRESGDLAAPLVLGGRSAGARVACRTAADEAADGVLTLAFPLHPPGRPERSRADELLAVGVPLLAVQGERDAFGAPADLEAVLAGRPAALVRAVPGDHALRKDLPAVVAAVLPWLASLCSVIGSGGGAAR